MTTTLVICDEAIESLPPGQQRMIRAIHKLTVDTENRPTFDELCVYLDIKSRNGIAASLKPLKRKGFVTWIPRSSRTLKLTGKCFAQNN
jgi:SOS-response transcriptional repressor LexA